MSKNGISQRDITNEVTSMFCSSIGQNIFMSVGYICVFFLLVEFAAVMVIQKEWCYYFWLGIPLGTLLVAADGYFIFKNKDSIAKDDSVVLYAWVFVGFSCCICGFVTGFTGFFLPCFLTFLGLLCSMGSFITGALLRLRTHSVCALIAAGLSFIALIFQGESWPWQLPATALSLIFSLIIPGHLFSKYEKKYNILSDL